MWKLRHDKLKATLDFLKIGHHGSINATPPPPDRTLKSKSETDVPSVKEILDAILPLPKDGQKATAQAIVSTEREFYNPIPEGKLLVELGERVVSTRSYRAELKANGINEASIWTSPKAIKNKFFDKYEKNFLGELQPLRTELEHLLNPNNNYVEVEIAP